MNVRTIAVLTTLLLLTPVLAHSATPPPKQAAAALINEGNKLFKRGDFQAALARYRAAHELYPTPKIFFNMGEASRRLGRLPEAADLFERFLEESGVSKRSRLRRGAKRWLARIKKKVGVLTVRAEMVGASVFVDGKSVGTAPLKDLRLMPGPHEIVVEKPGFRSKIVRLTLVAGGRAEVDVTLEAVQPPPPPKIATNSPPPTSAAAPAVTAPPVIAEPPDEEGVTSKWWFWTVLAGVAVGAGATAFVLTRPGDYELVADLGVTSTKDWNQR